MGRVVRTVRDRASVGNPETFKSGGSVLQFHTRELKLVPPPLPPTVGWTSACAPGSRAFVDGARLGDTRNSGCFQPN